MNAFTEAMLKLPRLKPFGVLDPQNCPENDEVKTPEQFYVFVFPSHLEQGNGFQAMQIVIHAQEMPF